MTRHLALCSLLAALVCRVDEHPWNYLATLAVSFMAVCIALVWNEERKPHPATSWTPVIGRDVSVPRMRVIAVPTVTRRENSEHWS